jgi:hypothetical protein
MDDIDLKKYVWLYDTVNNPNVILQAFLQSGCILGPPKQNIPHAVGVYRPKNLFDMIDKVAKKLKLKRRLKDILFK